MNFNNLFKPVYTEDHLKNITNEKITSELLNFLFLCYVFQANMYFTLVAAHLNYDTEFSLEIFGLCLYFIKITVEKVVYITNYFKHT